MGPAILFRPPPCHGPAVGEACWMSRSSAFTLQIRSDSALRATVVRDHRRRNPHRRPEASLSSCPTVCLTKGGPSQLFKTDHHPNFARDQQASCGTRWRSRPFRGAHHISPIAEIGDGLYADGGLYRELARPAGACTRRSTSSECHVAEIQHLPRASGQQRPRGSSFAQRPPWHYRFGLAAVGYGAAPRPGHDLIAAADRKIALTRQGAWAIATYALTPNNRASRNNHSASTRPIRSHKKQFGPWQNVTTQAASNNPDHSRESLSPQPERAGILSPCGYLK